MKGTFLVVEDPARPGRLLYRREEYEIERWLDRREKIFWSRLVAFQIIFGSLMWPFVFGEV